MHEERFKLFIRSNREFFLFSSKFITDSLNKFYNSTGKKQARGINAIDF